jgi:hypothetical protein
VVFRTWLNTSTRLTHALEIETVAQVDDGPKGTLLVDLSGPQGGAPAVRLPSLRLGQTHPVNAVLRTTMHLGWHIWITPALGIPATDRRSLR